jgi:hypothetical protein
MGVSAIPYFARVPVSDALDAMNTIIQALNANFAWYGGSNGNAFTTLAAYKYWLANNGSPAYIYEVDNFMKADIAAPAAVLWQGDGVVQTGDSLYNFVAGLGIVVPPLNTLFDPSTPVVTAPSPMPSDYIPIIDV